MATTPRDFIASLKWPFVIALVVTVVFVLLPALYAPARVKPAQDSAASREAMRMLNDAHNRIHDQADRQRAESEQKAAEDAHAFNQAREEARRKAEEARLAAIREAERKLAEQRAAVAKRVAEASHPKEARKPKAEPEVATGTPLDIVPVAGSEQRPPQPRGPIETVVATVGDVTTNIKNTAVETVSGITGWIASTGDKILGRNPPPAPAPVSRMSSSAD